MQSKLAAIIQSYLRRLQKDFTDSLNDFQHTSELSFRSSLDTLLNALATELSGGPDAVIVHEPRKQGLAGRPDWRIHKRDTLALYGYIESKGLTPKPFNITPHLEQVTRYLSLGHKLIITDGIEFFCKFEEDAALQAVSLIDKVNMTSKDWASATINPMFEVMMRNFFASPAPQHCDEGRLVELVAVRTRLLSDEILKRSQTPVDEAMDEEERSAIILLNGLRDLVYNHSDAKMRNDKVFADFAAEVIMFALLYAHRIECIGTDSPLEKERKIKAYLTNETSEGQALRPFLSIMRYINNHENNDNFILAWTDECINFLSHVQMTEHQRQAPDYHKLFEQFLSKFDPRSRFDYGAFYTPGQLADCIVRVVDAIAKKSFKGESIYSDGNTIIDPCCGTGSFLEMIRLNDSSKGDYSLFGIELLPAPYMLANYRMAVLDRKIVGWRSRTELLMANTLSNCVFGEPANTGTVEGFELNRAMEISKPPITLIIGNPPSSDTGKSNLGEDYSIILKMMDDFRPPVEDRHARQNIQKQINNAYLQFLRWGCEKLENSKCHSILSYIVPSSFLEAESYKYARKYIIENFSNIWIASIDSDARTGVRTANLFNTQQGRALLVATRVYGESFGVSTYMHCDLSNISRTEKMEWLNQDAEEIMQRFTIHNVDMSNFAMLPSSPIDEKLYSMYWPVSSESEKYAIFNNYCSGVKLSPTSMFIHLKAPMLKRRSKEIMSGGLKAAEEWLGNQDKPPKDAEVSAFASKMNNYGDLQSIGKLLDDSIVNYAFRPFLTMKAFMWQDMLKEFSKVGGGGTRRRPEISAAYSSSKTVGFALSHSPKDQKESLKQFTSFCWHYPDNDLCRRGNSFIYLNQHPVKSNGGYVMQNNINGELIKKLVGMLAIDDFSASEEMVFYTFATLCSQVFLDKFEGALFTMNRADRRPRIPVVEDAEAFMRLSSLGRKLAELEKDDYIPDNLAGYNYAAIKSQVPRNFKLQFNKTAFDEERETIALTDGAVEISLFCPLATQRVVISGYEVIKNVWLKFNSYDYTHCPFTQEDMESFLNLVNKLLEYIRLVGEADSLAHEIIAGKYPLIQPIK
jgi:type I restriction-modification system DNA methylase subunit